MLPPVRLLADFNAPSSADSSAGADLPAGSGEFGSAFAALFRPPAAPPPAHATLPRAGAAGQPLPQSGNALPPPGALPVLSGQVTDLPMPARDPGAPRALRPGPTTGGDPVTENATLEHVSAPEPGSAKFVLIAPMPAEHASIGAIALPAVPAGPVAPGGLSGTAAMSPGDMALLRESLERPPRPDGRVTQWPNAALPPGSATAFATVPTDRMDSTGARLAAPTATPEAPAVLVQQTVTNPATTPSLQAALSQIPIPVDARNRNAAPATSTSPTPVFPVMPATAGTAAPASVGVVPDIAERPGSAGWGDALGDRVVWMTGHKIHNAEIRLNPADLGPVRVQISIDDGTTSINFHAHHPVTRDAIEQALPRLRDMLVEQGLTLGNTSVSDQGVSHQHSQAGRHGNVSAPFAGDDERVVHGEAVLPATPAAAAAGLVDLFA